jgi:hypothetical protein
MSAGSDIDLDDLMALDGDDGQEDSVEAAGLDGSPEDADDSSDDRESLSELERSLDEGSDEEDEDDEESDSDEDEDEGDDPEAEDEADEDEDASDESPEPDERDREIAELKAAILEQKAEQKQLRDYLLSQKGQAPQQPPQQQIDPRFISAVNALMLEAPEKAKETLDRLPPHVRNYAQDFVVRSYKDDVRYRIDPEAQFRERIMPFIQPLLDKALEPFSQDRLRGQARSAIAPHQETIDGFTDKEREEFQTALGLFSPDLDIHERVERAMELFQLRRGTKQTIKTRRKMEDKTRDLAATKASRRRGGGKQRTKKGKKGLPKLEGDDYAAYARQLKGMDLDPAEWQDLIG